MRTTSRVLCIAIVSLLSSAASASAAVCDLTTNGSTCGAIFNGVDFGNNAAFGEAVPQPVGTISLDAQGILLGDVPVVTINGVEYREFYLSMDDPSRTSKNVLSLDELKVYLLDSDDESTYSDTTLSGLTAIYDMDAGLKNTQDNWIKLNYSLNGDNGESGSMVAYIPNSLFTGPSTQVVYLSSRFGMQSGTGDGDFDDWWVMKRPATALASVPEPSALLLVGSGLAVAIRRFSKRPTRSSSSRTISGR